MDPTPAVGTGVTPKAGSTPGARAAEDTRRDWTVIQEDVGLSKTDKLRVNNGWLYRTSTPAGVAMVFVPGGE